MTDVHVSQLGISHWISQQYRQPNKAWFKTTKKSEAREHQLASHTWRKHATWNKKSIANKGNMHKRSCERRDGGNRGRGEKKRKRKGRRKASAVSSKTFNYGTENALKRWTINYLNSEKRSIEIFQPVGRAQYRDTWYFNRLPSVWLTGNQPAVRDRWSRRMVLRKLFVALLFLMDEKNTPAANYGWERAWLQTIFY